MEGLDFLLTGIGFSVLGYGLCYITLSVRQKSKTQNVTSEAASQSRERVIQQQQHHHRYSA